MKVIDFHCDVLYKMMVHDSVSFQDDERLTVTLKRLRQGKVGLQCFAVYMPEAIARPSFYDLLHAVDLFHEQILSHPELSFVRSAAELRAAANSGQIGTLLTMEGVDCLEGDLSLLRHAYRLGVRIVGLTWNYASWAADGVLEPRQSGLTLQGRRLVEECEQLGLILDVSHLSEPAFWEVMELYSGPIIASHSNAYHICHHPRNLTDRQIGAIISRGGLIGLTFVPEFLHASGEASIGDLIRHIDHICSLGGVNHVAFGSDFDGITKWTTGLEHPGAYEQLAIVLKKYYNVDWIERFLYSNGYHFLERNLP